MVDMLDYMSVKTIRNDWVLLSSLVDNVLLPSNILDILNREFPERRNSLMVVARY